MSDDPTTTPMDILRATAPEGARTYLGVAAALQSSTCTLMWTKLARQAGATQAEIAEAILVSRLMKMATVNDTAADALAWLSDNDD